MSQKRAHNIYHVAARCIKRFLRSDSEREGIKQIVFNSALSKSIGDKDRKAVFALCIETIKYWSLIDRLVSGKRDCIQIEMERELLFVYAYETVLGSGRRNPGRFHFFKHISTHLRSELTSLLQKEDLSTPLELLPKRLVELYTLMKKYGNVGIDRSGDKLTGLPKYTRVNLLDNDADNLVAEILGLKCTRECTTFDEFRRMIHRSKNRGSVPVLIDKFSVSGEVLCCFGPAMDVHTLPAIRNGGLVSQDKASCLPVAALDPPIGAFVLDACAAPGNKTSQAAKRVGQSGKVFAVDRNKERLGTLVNLCTKANVIQNVETISGDFLLLNPLDCRFESVTHIIVDPTCSGSGTYSMDRLLRESIHGLQKNDNAGRLESLGKFQKEVLNHAMKFESATKIVYSTCSVNAEENEQVVLEVLESNSKNGWKLAVALPEWNGSRGLEEYECHESVVRTVPENDLTGGFFVALFEREKRSRRRLHIPDRKRRKL